MVMRSLRLRARNAGGVRWKASGNPERRGYLRRITPADIVSSIVLATTR